MTEGGWKDKDGTYYPRRSRVEVPDAVAEYYGWPEEVPPQATATTTDEDEELEDGPLAEACSYCGADPGDPCVTSGGDVRDEPHAART